MCDSLEEGGARCAAHTRPAYNRVKGELASPTGERGATIESEANTLAVIAHASTKSGHDDVAALAESHHADPETAHWLTHCLREGEKRSDAARAVKDQITAKSMRSALRRIGAMRRPHRIDRNSPMYRALRAASEQEATARYTAFKSMADGDRSLHAPDGWIDDFKATGTHTRSVPTDRATAYALWRTQSTGSDFAPEHYDPDMCLGVVTRLDGMRPGDVIDEPGFRSLGAVEHEGKTIETINRDETGQPLNVTFTDGSATTARGLAGQFTVYRYASADEMAQMRRYDDARRRADAAGPSSGGHIPGQGWYVDDPDTGERVFDPWGV